MSEFPYVTRKRIATARLIEVGDRAYFGWSVDGTYFDNIPTFVWYRKLHEVKTFIKHHTS